MEAASPGGRLICRPFYPLYSVLAPDCSAAVLTAVREVKSVAGYVERRLVHLKEYCVELGNNGRLAEFYIQMGEIAAVEN
jgi:hypothetical protein